MVGGVILLKTPHHLAPVASRRRLHLILTVVTRRNVRLHVLIVLRVLLFL